ncbi:hypothetical protein JC221_237 [Yersinia phage JC221]|nr:hypothetical protein JC221_237 [Yersinia phage JC221]
MKTFDEILEAAKPFLNAMEKGRNAPYSDAFFETVVVLEKSRKYNRIVTDTRNKETGKMFEQRSCAGFIDNEGNIYKSASWKAPAKGIRGNIFDDKKGTGSITIDGFIYYMRGKG